MPRRKLNTYKPRGKAAINHRQAQELRRTEEGRAALDRLNFELNLRAYVPRPITLCHPDDIICVELAVGL